MLARGPTECDIYNSLAENRLGLPEGLSSGVHPPTGSPEPNNSLRPGLQRRSRSIYSVSASAKTELLAPSRQDLVVDDTSGLEAMQCA